MSFVGNLLWFVFGGGFIACFFWFVASVIFAITVIGIPFAKAAFRISVFSAFPFGRELIDGRLVGNERMTGTGIVNFLWCIFAGLWLAISHAILGVFCCISIIGIPFGLAHFKLAQVSFAPLGKVIVSSEVAKAAKVRAANAQLDESLTSKARKGGTGNVTERMGNQTLPAQSIPESSSSDPMSEILADERLKQLLLDMPVEKLQAIIDARSMRASG